MKVVIPDKGGRNGSMATTNTGQDMKTISIKGKQYVEVKERVRFANDEGGGYDMLEHFVVTLGNRHFVRVKIAYNGHTYYGTSEIKLDNADKGSADEKSPMECAETSAVGRAFAFAGVGVIDGIASADEMRRAGVSNNTDSRQTAPAGDKRPTEGQVRFLKTLGYNDEDIAGMPYSEWKGVLDNKMRKAGTQPTPKAAPKPVPTYDDVPEGDLPF